MPGTRAYHPLFGPQIVGELVLNAVLLLWALELLYLFFAKGRSFPVAMITFMILRVVSQVAGLGVAIDPGDRGPHRTGRLRRARRQRPRRRDLGALPGGVPRVDVTFVR